MSYFEIFLDGTNINNNNIINNNYNTNAIKFFKKRIGILKSYNIKDNIKKFDKIWGLYKKQKYKITIDNYKPLMSSLFSYDILCTLSIRPNKTYVKNIKKLYK